jgi:dihydroxyacid dehydratase/phosphogluconate dehydratase
MAERKNPRSWKITEGRDRAPNRAMMRAVASPTPTRQTDRRHRAWEGNITPCNVGLAELGVAAAGRSAPRAACRRPTARSISDGISMGTEGGLARLARDRRLDRDRHARADDGVLAIGGCDKNARRAVALKRLDVPAIFVYAERSRRAATRAATSRWCRS